MNSRAENFYAVWRERCRAVNLLRDGGSLPPEKLLQAVWQHQRLRRDQLQTVDGKCLRVLHPGFASAEGGPDFRGAVLQFESGTPLSGDVEIDLQPSGWHAHGHDTNPSFKNVILHVVWEDAPGSKPNDPGSRARLALKRVLDAPPAELALALENESGLPENLRGKCSAPLRELSAQQLSAVLHAAAKARFQNKADAILARAKNSGWEQAFWENLFRALGYKQVVPNRRNSLFLEFVDNLCGLRGKKKIKNVFPRPRQSAIHPPNGQHVPIWSSWQGHVLMFALQKKQPKQPIHSSGTQKT